MNTYKPGDHVRFRDDLEDGKMYGGLYYIAMHMDRFRGGVYKVRRCHSGNHYFLYGCSLNGQYFYISADMLLPVKPEEYDPAWGFDRKELTNAK